MQSEGARQQPERVCRGVAQRQVDELGGGKIELPGTEEFETKLVSARTGGLNPNVYGGNGGSRARQLGRSESDYNVSLTTFTINTTTGTPVRHQRGRIPNRSNKSVFLTSAKAAFRCTTENCREVFSIGHYR